MRVRSIPSRAALFFCVCSTVGCSSGPHVLGWETSLDATLPPAGSGYFARWPNGPSSDPSFFPIMVWMQSPDNAARFRDHGVNFFTGLWQGPTEAQLVGLASAGMPAACSQTGVWEEHLDDPAIEAWLQPDQPDNAQLQADGTYAGCIDPDSIVADYSTMVERDPTRPVFMNLGRGVVDENWEGRGSCSGRSDMYPAYAKGADVLTLITYPVNAGLPLDTVARGVDTLRGYSAAEKPVVAAVEASDIAGSGGPTREQIRAEVWLALVHGAGGIQYFCHRTAPDVSETACIDDAATGVAMRTVNAEVTELAPVLNTPSLATGATTVTTPSSAVVDTMMKRNGGATYLFAVSPQAGNVTARFALPAGPESGTVDVLGEQRTLPIAGSAFSDEFSGYGVHLYRLSF
jgi:hypothetical protein